MFVYRLVCLSLSLECRTSFPPRCHFHSTCEYGVERCAKSSETSVRGGVYCTTLVNSLEEMLIENMGCMYDQETSKSCLNQSECRMKYTNQQQTFLHCCCNQDFCNLNLNLSVFLFSFSSLLLSFPSLFVSLSFSSNPVVPPSSSSLNGSEDSSGSEGRWWCRSSFCPAGMSLLLFVLSVLFVVVLLLFLLFFVCFSKCRVRARRPQSSKWLFKWLCHSLEKPSQSLSLELEGEEEKEALPVSSKIFNNDNEEEEEEEEEGKGKEIDRHSLVVDRRSLLKCGRFGEICLGRYGDEQVVLKILVNSTSLDSVHLLFEREKSIYSLPFFCHPNLLRFFGSLILDRSECLVLQFASGGSLKEFLREHRINDEEQLILLSQQIADALEYLHQDFTSPSFLPTKIEGRNSLPPRSRRARFPIAHRDLKSENILLGASGRVLLADFAMSTEVNPRDFSSLAHQQLGTPRYMSPEILAGTIGKEWDSLLKCDLYALALVFWELISRLNNIGQSLFSSLHFLHCDHCLESSVSYLMPYEEQLSSRNLPLNPSVGEMLEILHLPPPFNRPLIRQTWRSTSTRLEHFLQTIEQAWETLPEARINSALVAHRMRQL